MAARLYGHLKPLTEKMFIIGKSENEDVETEKASDSSSSNVSLQVLNRQTVQHEDLENLEAILTSEMMAQTF